MVADADGHIPAPCHRESPYHLVRVIVDPQRLAEPILQGIDGMIPSANRTDVLKLSELLSSVDMPGITEAEPFRNAFAVLAQCPVERGPDTREVGPVACESPTLDEAEHLRGKAAAAVKLLECSKPFAADEQQRESLRTVFLTTVCITLEHDPMREMSWAVFGAKEGIPIVRTSQRLRTGLGRNHLQMPVGRDVLLPEKAAMA